MYFVIIRYRDTKVGFQKSSLKIINFQKGRRNKIIPIKPKKCIKSKCCGKVEQIFQNFMSYNMFGLEHMISILQKLCLSTTLLIKPWFVYDTIDSTGFRQFRKKSQF